MLPVQHPQHGAASLGTATSPRGWGCWDPPVSPPKGTPAAGADPRCFPGHWLFWDQQVTGLAAGGGNVLVLLPSFLPSLPLGSAGGWLSVSPWGGEKPRQASASPAGG